MKTRNHKNAFLALLLSLVMIISMFPAGALQANAAVQETTFFERDSITAAEVINFDPVCTENYIVEFTWNYVSTDARVDIYLCGGRSQSYAQVRLRLNPATPKIGFYSGANNDKAASNISNGFYQHPTGSRIKVVVDQENGTYQLFVNGELTSHSSVGNITDIPFTAEAGKTGQLERLQIGAACNLTNFRIYTVTEVADPEPEPDDTPVVPGFNGDAFAAVYDSAVLPDLTITNPHETEAMTANVTLTVKKGDEALENANNKPIDEVSVDANNGSAVLVSGSDLASYITEVGVEYKIVLGGTVTVGGKTYDVDHTISVNRQATHSHTVKMVDGNLCYCAALVGDDATVAPNKYKVIVSNTDGEVGNATGEITLAAAETQVNLNEIEFFSNLAAGTYTVTVEAYKDEALRSAAVYENYIVAEPEPEPEPEEFVDYTDDFTTFEPAVNATAPTIKNTWWVTDAQNAVRQEDGTVQVTSLAYVVPGGITKDYTVEFKYQLPSGSKGTVKLGSDVKSTNLHTWLKFTGGNETTGDRLGIEGVEKAAVYGGQGEWHDVQVVVSFTDTAFKVYVDGQLVTIEAQSEFDFYNEITTLNRVSFDCTTGDMLIDDFKIYLGEPEVEEEPVDETWINQQAELGGKVKMTFTVAKEAHSSIASVRVTMGDNVQTLTDLAVGKSIEVSLAAAQMSDEILLEALAADGTLVYDKKYSVADYLKKLNAVYPDNEKQVALVNHTLNYGSAANALFKGGEYTPIDGLTAVPDVQQVGDNLKLIGAGAMYYKKVDALTGTFTVQFRYQAGADQNGYFKLGDNNTSTTLDVQLKLIGQDSTSGDRVVISYNGGTHNYYYEKDADNGWRRVTVTVNSSTQKFQLWLDGQQVFWDHDKNKETPEIAEFDCVNGASVGLAKVSFDASAGKEITIDDFAVYSGANDDLVFEERFNAFTSVTGSGQITSEGWVVSADKVENVVNTKKDKNPVSSADDIGVTAKSATLLFEDLVRVRYTILLGEGKSLSDYTIKIGDTEVAAEDIKSPGGNKYYVYSDDINPQMYANSQKLTISPKAGEGKVVVDYSPLDYITRQCAKESTDAKLKDLLKAMYNYYLSARNLTP